MKQKAAIKTMIALLIAVSLFHISILLKIIPYEMTWGGRLENDRQMYTFETLSLAVNLLLLAMVLIKGGYLKPFVPMKVVRVILWIFVVLFALNTIGNLLAETTFEKMFAGVTLLSSLLLFMILRKGKSLEAQLK
jgi:hypothetical protein